MRQKPFTNMSRVTLIDPIESIKGKIHKRGESIFRCKQFRDEQGLPKARRRRMSLLILATAKRIRPQMPSSTSNALWRSQSPCQSRIGTRLSSPYLLGATLPHPTLQTGASRPVRPFFPSPQAVPTTPSLCPCHNLLRPQGFG